MVEFQEVRHDTLDCSTSRGGGSERSNTDVFAQDAVPGPGAVVITIIPGGATFFTEAKDNPQAPSFGNYDLGGAVAVNLNRYPRGRGRGQRRDRRLTDDAGWHVHGRWQVTPPAELQRQPRRLRAHRQLGRAVRHGRRRRPDVFERRALIVDDAETFLTGNVGGGVNWYAGRWGLRGDYRFVAVQSKDDAPAFFGQETRYGHRVYGGVLLNVGR